MDQLVFFVLVKMSTAERGSVTAKTRDFVKVVINIFYSLSQGQVSHWQFPPYDEEKRRDSVLFSPV